ncbi:MAG: MFS transporter [Bacteroidota bacterium]
MTKSKQSNNALLAIIFLTVFIDMLGVSIVIPVIPGLFFSDTSEFFNAGVSENFRSIVYGYLVAAYPLMQFFGAPFLGALSDRYGRKPVLSVSLVGTLIGYILFAVAIIRQDIYLLFFSRLLPGFTGGNISIALSAIADISEAKDKAKNFGLVGAAFGLGFILGPAIGGFLADSTVVSWFTHATPFWVTAGLTFVNIMMVQFLFPETLREKQMTPLSFLTGFRNIATSFRTPHLRTIFVVVLLIALGFSFFTQFFSVLLFQKFSYTEKSIGLLYGWVGIWLVITQGLIVRRLSGNVAPSKILRISIIALALSIGVILLPSEAWWFYLLNPFIALSQGLTSPNLTTVVSEQASAKQQGQILGINQSMQSIGATVPPIVAGYLNALNGNLPLLAGAFFCVLGWAVFVFVFRR